MLGGKPAFHACTQCKLPSPRLHDVLVAGNRGVSRNSMLRAAIVLILSARAAVATVSTIAYLNGTLMVTIQGAEVGSKLQLMRLRPEATGCADSVGATFVLEEQPITDNYQSMTFPAEKLQAGTYCAMVLSPSANYTTLWPQELRREHGFFAVANLADVILPWLQRHHRRRNLRRAGLEPACKHRPIVIAFCNPRPDLRLATPCHYLRGSIALATKAPNLHEPLGAPHLYEHGHRNAFLLAAGFFAVANLADVILPWLQRHHRRRNLRRAGLEPACKHRPTVIAFSNPRPDLRLATPCYYLRGSIALATKAPNLHGPLGAPHLYEHGHRNAFLLAADLNGLRASETPVPCKSWKATVTLQVSYARSSAKASVNVLENKTPLCEHLRVSLWKMTRLSQFPPCATHVNYTSEQTKVIANLSVVALFENLTAGNYCVRVSIVTILLHEAFCGMLLPGKRENDPIERSSTLSSPSYCNRYLTKHYLQGATYYTPIMCLLWRYLNKGMHLFGTLVF
ncbi:uncharacterized protein LOC142592534 isoform X3 [Dermacentor variabilis]|uniref:uncharacterized protein LOC142592534 isoform X3 n=1 Tax=Dermacentor variabilis TaxID=34621 RepID=UPI003F5CAA95